MTFAVVMGSARRHDGPGVFAHSTEATMSTRTTAILVFLSAAAVSPAAYSPTNIELVAPAALEKLLPAAPEGWTRLDVRLKQIDISQECSYTSAATAYTKGEMRVKLTLADTGSHEEGLMALAMSVVTLPDNHFDQIPPATTIRRVKIDGSPAVEMWDAEKINGEITVVVGGRFVASVEASKADSLETLRAILTGVDLKALSALK
jgi:hypothetical protein